MSEFEQSPDPATTAAQHADLGLPVPHTRFRFLKRVLARLGRLVIHHQVAYNHAMLESLDRLRASVDQLRAAQAAAEARAGNEVGALRSDLNSVHQAALETASDIARFDAQLDAADLGARQLGDEMTSLAGSTDEV